MNIYIIRHGETEANKLGVLQGWTDWPLNEYGRQLAIESGKGMKKAGLKFDIAFASSLSRSYETAQLVLKASGNEHTPITVDNRIKEINCGELEGVSLKGSADPKLLELMKGFYYNPLKMPPIPGGESPQEAMERTQAFLKELARKKYENVLVSTHGCALRCMLNFLYENPEDFWHGQMPLNCCVNVVEVKGEWMRLKEEDILFYDKSLAVDRFDFLK